MSVRQGLVMLVVFAGAAAALALAPPLGPHGPNGPAAPAGAPPVAALPAPAGAAASAALAVPAAALTLADVPPSLPVERGRKVYENWCIGCHGVEGRGDGAAVRFLSPPPRDFQRQRFKFRSTPSGELPTEADLLHVVTCGLNGSAMPGFPLMPDPQKRDVVSYVRYLAEFGLLQAEVDYVMEDEGLTLDQVRGERLAQIREEVLADAYGTAWPVPVTPETENDAASVARGQALYEKQCVACHGASGRGDGSASYHLRDWKDAEIRPRDFTTGVFRAGSAPLDLFLRMRTGLNGTPMPSVSGTDAELWDLVHFILSLKDPTAAHGAAHPTSCDARRIAGETPAGTPGAAPTDAPAGEVRR